MRVLLMPKIACVFIGCQFVQSFPRPIQPSFSRTKSSGYHASHLYRLRATSAVGRLADDTCFETSSAVDELVMKAGLSPIKQNLTITKLSSEGAFCNSVYRISPNHAAVLDPAINPKNTSLFTPSLIAKIFSNVSLDRMGIRDSSAPHRIGELDRAVAQRGLSPRVVASSDRGILTEQCSGRVLTEMDLHRRENTQLCRLVARSLAQLHKTPGLSGSASSRRKDGGTGSQRQSLLWHSCEQMLHMSNPRLQHKGWSIERFQLELGRQRARLDERCKLPLVDVGHGDFKPANVIYDDHRGAVQFIDLELAGTHYRSFDLAKFFRTEHPSSFTDTNQRAFHLAYLEHLEIDSGTTLLDIQQEVRQMLPMTWLEAAIFFACMASQDPLPERVHRWNELVQNRLLGYERSMNLLNDL